VSVRFQSVKETARRRVLEVGRTTGLAEEVARDFGAELETAGAFDELPFPARTFDCVVAAPELSDAAVAELRRVLYEDGSLVALSDGQTADSLYHEAIERLARTRVVVADVHRRRPS